MLAALGNVLLCSQTVWRVRQETPYFRGSAAAVPIRPSFDAATHRRVADRSLLIRTPQITDHAAVSMAAIVPLAYRRPPAEASRRIAAQFPLLVVPKAAAHFAQWTAYCNTHRAGCLAVAPFRLLAISLRPDLAYFRPGPGGLEDGMVRGVEVRFEYALDRINPQIPVNPGELFVIMEFILPPMAKADFKRLVATWRGYADLSDAQFLANVASDLPTVAASSEAVRLRLTANAGPVNEKLWHIREYHFDRAKGRIAAASLDGEISRGNWRNPASGPCDLTQVARDFVQVFQPAGDRIVLPEPLRADAATIRRQTMLEIPRSSSDPLRKRFLLSLNTCTGCHSAELTSTVITHLTMRRAGEQSWMSPFLRGAAGYGDTPELNSWHEVEIRPSCTPPERNTFNDLLRRHLYLQRVMTLSPGAGDWSLQLAPFRIFEAH